MFEFRRYRLPRAAASSRHCTAAARQRIAKERFQREGAADPARAHCPPQSEVPAGLDRRQHGHRAARLRPQRPADRLCASATHSAHAVGTMQQVVRGQRAHQWLQRAGANSGRMQPRAADALRGARMSCTAALPLPLRAPLHARRRQRNCCRRSRWLRRHLRGL